MDFSEIVALSQKILLMRSHFSLRSCFRLFGHYTLSGLQSTRYFSSPSSSVSWTIPSIPDYKTALRELYSLNLRNPVKLGLQNIQRVYELTGRPLQDIPIVHVAGTNGKGSVCLKIAATLREAGLKTGLFISPHISSYRERIQVNGTLIDEAFLIREVSSLLQLCHDNHIPITFFELTTALAFLYYKASECEVIVLEVGLGGRTDSTNVITPLVSVITSIQLDHCKILGDTLQLIAREKSGIMKPGVPVVIGPGCDVVKAELENEALKVSSPLFHIEDILAEKERKFDTSSSASFDIDNLNTDIAHAVIRLLQRSSNPSPLSSKLLALSDSQISESLAARPPCRFEIVQVQQVDVVLDIAHNVDAIECLVRKIQHRYGQRKIHIVVGMSADKDVENSLRQLVKLVPDASYITCIEVRVESVICCCFDGSCRDERLFL